MLLGFILLSVIGTVLSLEARIGNARMVLRAETGDTLEKYIRVINSNEVAVDIELTASGDLEEDIEIQDDKFTLQPGEEKKAYFNINVRKEGTSESNIYIKFIPIEEGNGVGVISTIVVIAEKGDGDGNFIPADSDDIPNDVDDSDNTDSDGGVNVDSKRPIKDDDNGNNTSPAIIIFTISTMVLLVVFLVLIIIASGRKKIKIEKKGEHKGGKVNQKKKVKRHG